MPSPGLAGGCGILCPACYHREEFSVPLPSSRNYPVVLILHIYKSWGEDYNKGMEDMRKRMEAEMQEMEEKLRTAAKLMVLKERESWRSDRQQILDERRTIQKKLSVTEEDNRKLKSDLQKEKEKIKHREEEIWTLHCQLSAQEKKYDSSMFLWWKKLNEERDKAAGEMKKRDELIISLQQSLHTQKEETERKGASVDECSSRLKSEEESLQKKVSQLEELLSDKYKGISRANEKRRARTITHIDTLALLNKTQSALEQSKLTCNTLEEKLRKQLAERQESHQKELAEREESFQKELSETVRKFRKELSTLSESWERKSQQWEKQKREPEETLQAKDKIWIHEEAQRKEEIQRLTEENLQLQELMVKKTTMKKSFWSWSRNK